MIPLGFLGARRDGLLPLWPSLFSLPAIIAVTWYEWELRPRQKYDSVGIRLTPLRHSQGLVSPSDFQPIWQADQYGIWVNCTRKKAPSIDPRSSPSRWPIGLAASTAMSKQTTSF